MKCNWNIWKTSASHLLSGSMLAIYNVSVSPQTEQACPPLNYLTKWPDQISQFPDSNAIS